MVNPLFSFLAGGVFGFSFTDLLSGKGSPFFSLICAITLAGITQQSDLKKSWRVFWPLLASGILAVIGHFKFHLDPYQHSFIRIFLLYLGMPPLLGLTIGFLFNNRAIKTQTNWNLIPKKHWFIYFLSLFSIWLFWLAYTQHQNLWSMNHVNTNLIYNLAHGSFIFSQSDRGIPLHIFGWHFYPNWILIAPLYRLIEKPVFLVILQTLSMSLGAIPIYRYARNTLKSEPLALTLTLGYLTSLPLALAHLWAVEARTISTGFASFMLYFLFTERKKGFWIFFLLFLGWGEANAFLTAPLGLFLLYRKKYRLGLGVFLVSVLYFITAQKIALHVNHGVYLYAKAQSEYLSYFLHPIAGLKILIAPKTIIIFALFLLAGSYFCILDPLLLVILPTVCLNFLNVDTRDLIFSYGYVPILPFVVFAGIHGCQKIIAKRATWRKHLKLTPSLFVLHLFGFILLPAQTYVEIYQEGRFLTDQRTETIKNLTDKIPANASVSTTTLLESHLANRTLNYWFPRWKVPEELAQAFHVSFQDDTTRDSEFIAIDLRDFMLKHYEEHTELKSLLKNPDYGIWLYDAGLLIFKRGHHATLWDHILVPGNDSGNRSEKSRPSESLELLDLKATPSSTAKAGQFRLDYTWRILSNPQEEIWILTEFSRTWPDYRHREIHQPVYGLLRGQTLPTGKIFHDSIFFNLPATAHIRRDPLEIRVSVLKGPKPQNLQATLQTLPRLPQSDWFLPLSTTLP